MMQLTAQDIQTLRTWTQADEADMHSIKSKLLPGQEYLDFEVVHRPSIDCWEIRARRVGLRDIATTIYVTSAGRISWAF